MQPRDIAIVATVSHSVLLIIGSFVFKPLHRRIWRAYDNGKFPAAHSALWMTLYLTPTFIFMSSIACWMCVQADTITYAYFFLFLPLLPLIAFFFSWICCSHKKDLDGAEGEEDIPDPVAVVPYIDERGEEHEIGDPVVLSLKNAPRKLASGVASYQGSEYEFGSFDDDEVARYGQRMAVGGNAGGYASDGLTPSGPEVDEFY